MSLSPREETGSEVDQGGGWWSLSPSGSRREGCGGCLGAQGFSVKVLRKEARSLGRGRLK